MAKHWLEELVGVPCRVEIASEFRYSAALLRPQTLFVAISQSGETADTLAALRLAKSKQAHTLAIVNVKGSALAVEADSVLYTHAGPEIAVASTKAYTVQLLILYLLMLAIGEAQGKLSEQVSTILSELLSLPDIYHELMSKEEVIEKISERLMGAQDAFFIGRGRDFASAMEASIKLKEISYIHSEAYAAGELKHGTLSLIEDQTPVIAIVTDHRLYEKMRSNIREVKSRGAMVILIAAGDFPHEEDLYDVRLDLLPGRTDLLAFQSTIYVQLLAYYVAKHKGLDVDHPRNLAKSVTVE